MALSAREREVLALKQRLAARGETIDRLDAELRQTKRRLTSAIAMLRRVKPLMVDGDLSEKELEALEDLTSDG